jgi:hypothetical protein
MPRVAGASLGLLAFSVVLIGGLISQNPATVTLSRGILALFLFFLIGLALGMAAQHVIAEYERQRKDELHVAGPDGAEGDLPGTAQTPANAPGPSVAGWATRPRAS